MNVDTQSFKYRLTYYTPFIPILQDRDAESKVLKLLNGLDDDGIPDSIEDCFSKATSLKETQTSLVAYLMTCNKYYHFDASCLDLMELTEKKRSNAFSKAYLPHNYYMALNVYSGVSSSHYDCIPEKALVDARHVYKLIYDFDSNPHASYYGVKALWDQYGVLLDAEKVSTNSLPKCEDFRSFMKLAMEIRDLKSATAMDILPDVGFTEKFYKHAHLRLNKYPGDEKSLIYDAYVDEVPFAVCTVIHNAYTEAVKNYSPKKAFKELEL